jgi:two-component system chemotaxis response regulator CheB
MSPTDVVTLLLADDSLLARQAIVAFLRGATDFEMVAEATTGLDAVRLNNSLQPRLIAMDVNMPILDGIQATKLIMQETPTRVVMLGTSAQVNNSPLMKQVMGCGALDFCEKPSNPSDEEVGQRMLKTLRAMSKLSVVRRTTPIDQALADTVSHFSGLQRRPEIVLIVSSTGGPQALETIIKALPHDFHLPIVIVQHISAGFMDNMAHWLDGVTPLDIKMAANGEKPQSGYIYFAPHGVHLRFTFNGRFALEADTQQARHVPSGDVLLESAAQAYGSTAIGIVLTGMGIDGAKGLSELRKRGAHTIVQDEKTSIVFGMPKAAIELGGSEFVAPLEDIAPILVYLANKEVNDE